MSSWFVKRRAKKTILESCCDNWAKYKRFAHSCLWACEPLFCVGVLSVVALGSIAIVKDVWIKSQNASHSNRTKHAKGREKKQQLTTFTDMSLCVCVFSLLFLYRFVLLHSNASIQMTVQWKSYWLWEWCRILYPLAPQSLFIFFYFRFALHFQ